MSEDQFQVLSTVFQGVDNVLEVGCGQGTFTQFLGGICTRVTAIDISPIKVSKAKEKMKDRPNVTICELDALNMEGLTESSYDVIVLYRTLHFLQDIPTFYREATRLLRQDGKIVVISSPVFELSCDGADIGPIFDGFWSETFPLVFSKVILASTNFDHILYLGFQSALI